MVVVDGEQDFSTNEALADLLGRLVEEHPAKTIEVDLEAVTFIDSGALGVLVAARKKALKKGGDLRVTNPCRSVGRVLSVSGLEPYLVDGVGA